MRQSPWEPTSCKASPQNSPFLNETWKAQHYAHSVPLFPVLNYINPFHILTHCFFKISFSIVLLCMLSLPFRFPEQKCVYISHLCHILYALSISAIFTLIKPKLWHLQEKIVLVLDVNWKEQLLWYMVLNCEELVVCGIFYAGFWILWYYTVCTWRRKVVTV